MGVPHPQPDPSPVGALSHGLFSCWTGRNAPCEESLQKDSKTARCFAAVKISFQGSNGVRFGCDFWSVIVSKLAIPCNRPFWKLFGKIYFHFQDSPGR